MVDSGQDPRPEVAQYLQVHVAPHDLAIPLSLVQHIRGTAAVRPTGGGGLGIDVDGSTVPVLDFAALLGLPARSLDRSESLIVVQGGPGRYGLRVDRTCEIIELADRGIHDVAGALEIPAELLIGVALQPFPLAVLNGERLLTACRAALS